MYRKVKPHPNKLALLLRQDRRLFHTSDLALLWDIQNYNTLYTTISRYIKKGILYRIQKGLYSTVPPSSLDPMHLGASLIHSYAYLSTESVLAHHGIISQSENALTFISNRPQKLRPDSYTFLVRQLKDKYLYHDAGITNQQGLNIASPERAAADMLYFNPRFHFDAPNLLDQKKLRQIRSAVYPP